MRLTICYGDAASFIGDLEELRARGGIFVRVEDRPLVSGASLEVILETPGGSAMVSATVIQAIASQGVAIQFDANDMGIIGIEETARADGSTDGPPVTATWGDAPAPTRTPEENRRAARPAADVPVHERLKTASKNEKMQMALRGSRNERAALIRDRDKSLHLYVLKNPKIGIDEIAAIARMGTVSPDVLKMIASRREWFQRPDVAAALCRNPKVSPVTAKKLLAFVSGQELRQMAKGNGVREAVAAEARRRLFGKR